MAEDNRDALVSTEVSKPVPRDHPFGRHDDLIAVGGDGLEKRFAGRLHVTVQQHFTGLVEAANRHGAGVSIEATVIGVLFGVESHGGLRLVRDEGFCHSEPPTAVCRGGGLNTYQRTAAEAP
jgi:hypothetical protein